MYLLIACFFVFFFVFPLSSEVLPSITQVRREEIDDIYVLPSLENEEKNR